MKKITAVEPRDGYRIWVQFDDGVDGELDLQHLAGSGVFKAWVDMTVFRQVRVGEFGELCWGENIDLCPDAIYMRITGLSADKVLGRAEASAHA